MMMFPVQLDKWRTGKQFLYALFAIASVSCGLWLSSWMGKPIQGKNDLGIAVDPLINHVTITDGKSHAEFEFKIKNEGTSRVEILEVKTSCQCTVVELSGTVLESNGSVTLRVTYDVMKYNGNLPQRRVWIKSTDKNNPILECFIGGERRERYGLSQEMVDFGSLEKGDVVEREVIVESLIPEYPLDFMNLVSSNEWIKANVERVERLGSVERLYVKIGVEKESPEGSFYGQIQLPGYAEDKGGVTIHVKGNVKGPVKAVPRSVFLGIVFPGGSTSKYVSLISRERESAVSDLAIQRFENLHNGLAVNLEDENSGRFEIRAIHRFLPKGEFRHNIVVGYELFGKAGRIEVPVTALVK